LPRIEKRLGELNPPPVRKIPVLIGGGGEKKTLKLVAKHADIWHSFSDLDTLKHKSEILAAHCAKVGRDPLQIERSVGVGHQDPDDLGQKYLAAGAGLFTVGVGGPHYDLSHVRRWVEWRDSL